MKYFATTATALFLATTPALAQVAAPVEGAPVAATEQAATETDWAQLIRTRDITGGPVYTTNEAHNDGTWGDRDDYAWGRSGYDAVDTNWNQIGEIEDVVLDRSGQLVGVVVEVGGFLDIGDKHVLLRVGDVDLVPVDDQSYSLVTRYSEDQLKELEGVDESWWQ
ncbi:MAG: PRC-barrel domain-containing protein [Allorhizobium sp.]